MELKNLAIGTVIFTLMIGGFIGFITNFSDHYETTTMDSKYATALDKYDEANSQAIELDNQVDEEGGEDTGGSWSWNPMDWQVFKAFNVIKWLRNLISIPKDILTGLPNLFIGDGLEFYTKVGITLLIIAIAFAIIVAFTKSGKL